MRRVLAVLLSIGFLVGIVPNAQSASLADCISVTSGQFKKTSYETTYSISYRNACGDAYKEQLNNTTLSFYADSSVLNPEITYVLYLQTYGTDWSFKLRNLKAGSYRPYLQISVLKDRSFRTVNLPGFTIADPLNCIAITDSQYRGDKYESILRINLRSECSDLSSSDFSGIQFTLNVPGYYSYIGSQSIFSLASYGTYLDFSLRDLKPGTYVPIIEIRDKGFKTRSITLFSFTIAGSPTPTPIPTRSASTSSNGNSSLAGQQLCAISKGLIDQCSEYPNFNFEFCSSLQKASLQEKVGSTWVYQWTVIGTKDPDVCSESRYPFYVSVIGENVISKKTYMRLVFTKTSKIPSYTQSFSLEIR